MSSEEWEWKVSVNQPKAPPPIPYALAESAFRAAMRTADARKEALIETPSGELYVLRHVEK